MESTTTNFKLKGNKKAKVAIFVSIGTYDFNHMAIFANRYVNESKTVRHVSYLDLPDNFMDKNNIEEAKRVVSKDEFNMEYMAMIVEENKVNDNSR